MWALINQQFVEDPQALLHVSDLSVQRGYGVFDFFRTAAYIPLFIDQHLDRLENSAAVLGLQLPYNKEELKKILRELISKNNIPDSGIRITLTGGFAADTYTVTTPNIIITQMALSMDPVFDASKGLHLISEEYVRELPMVKSINYLMGVYLQQKVKDAGADDVLYVKNGYISELPRSNVFIVTADNELITAKEHILHGITRKNILIFAKEQMEVKEQPVSLNDVLTAKEIFVSSTTKRLLPVFSVNGIVIADGNPGTVTSNLYQRFLVFEQNNLNAGW